MANILCASTGNKIRLKKKGRDKAMAKASATIFGHQGIDEGANITEFHRVPWARDTNSGPSKES